MGARPDHGFRMADDKPRRPRFRDLAEAAGVGTATVERVLNGRGNVAPDTARRVLLAAQRLGYERALPSLHRAHVRIEVILVRPDNQFFVRLNRAFEAAAATLDRSIVLHRTFLEENTPEEVARRIESAVAEREALIVVVQDHPRIIQALDVAGRRGRPVVLLASDVRSPGRAVYVGIDNESAGRTAGYLMRRMLQGRRGTVLALCHSGRYLNHRQRLIGFSRHFRDMDDDLVFRRCLFTNDDERRAEAVVQAALEADPDVVGLYNAGGGNAGVGAALRGRGLVGEVFYVGHELSPISRDLLGARAMALAIDQDPERQVERAIENVLRLLGLSESEPDRSPIPFRIVTPENMG